MTLAGSIRASLLVAAAVVVLALPAAASAKGPAALGARAHLLTAGPYAGRVAVAANVSHPADALRRTDSVRIDVSRGGAALATGSDQVTRPIFTSVFATHTVLLDAGESRSVRAAARGGHRLRLTVTSTPGDGGAVQVATATVALGSTSLPPLASGYQSLPTRTYLYVTDDQVTEIDQQFFVSGLSWTPDGGGAAIGPSPDGTATWSASGAWNWQPSADLPSSPPGGPFSGSFTADGQHAQLTLPSLLYGPITLEPMTPFS